MKYSELSLEEKREQFKRAQIEFDCLCKLKLSLDLSRGKPIGEQLDLSNDMFNVLTGERDYIGEGGVDYRNYGMLDGIPEAKKLFSDLLEIPAKNIFVGGNSSLNMIYDALTRLMLHGAPGVNVPWCKYDKVKFICPAPGYDRHFSMLENLGIEMITVEYLDNGQPDMDKIEELAKDPEVHGLICVPKYSNPTGYTYSRESVRRLAKMECAAPDFRIIWDNAYFIHDLYTEEKLADIFELAKRYGTEDRVMYFASTSKITFPGAGIAVMALSDNNMAQAKKLVNVQTIGSDKINQLRQVRFLGDAENVRHHMERHAEIIRPKFDLVFETLEAELGGLGIASWTRPNGGYFISLTVMDGCAKRVWNLMKEAGGVLTGAGATYPYGKDPRDANLRLAPTFSALHELEVCIQALSTCVRLASLEKLLEGEN
ncbi:MAG: aminotransferase class I/II-fold pyridoxal phosphate-dependent enzyme [Clostridia bacterium]|nr:aminotransferase class I/II-fold pyridoxal phosphate-dependent enzyme [Clostridia bacterium]